MGASTAGRTVRRWPYWRTRAEPRAPPEGVEPSRPTFGGSGQHPSAGAWHPWRESNSRRPAFVALGPRSIGRGIGAVGQGRTGDLRLTKALHYLCATTADGAGDRAERRGPPRVERGLGSNRPPRCRLRGVVVRPPHHRPFALISELNRAVPCSWIVPESDRPPPACKAGALPDELTTLQWTRGDVRPQPLGCEPGTLLLSYGPSVRQEGIEPP